MVMGDDEVSVMRWFAPAAPTDHSQLPVGVPYTQTESHQSCETLVAPEPSSWAPPSASVRCKRVAISSDAKQPLWGYATSGLREVPLSGTPLLVALSCDHL